MYTLAQPTPSHKQGPTTCALQQGMALDFQHLVLLATWTHPERVPSTGLHGAETHSLTGPSRALWCRPASHTPGTIKQALPKRDCVEWLSNGEKEVLITASSRAQLSAVMQKSGSTQPQYPAQHPGLIAVGTPSDKDGGVTTASHLEPSEQPALCVKGFLVLFASEASWWPTPPPSPPLLTTA